MAQDEGSFGNNTSILHATPQPGNNKHQEDLDEMEEYKGFEFTED
jgi:hypothetical protein